MNLRFWLIRESRPDFRQKIVSHRLMARDFGLAPAPARGCPANHRSFGDNCGLPGGPQRNCHGNDVSGLDVAVENRRFADDAIEKSNPQPAGSRVERQPQPIVFDRFHVGKNGEEMVAALRTYRHIPTQICIRRRIKIHVAGIWLRSLRIDVWTGATRNQQQCRHDRNVHVSRLGHFIRRVSWPRQFDSWRTFANRRRGHGRVQPR